MNTNTAVFIINLLQDVNILRPLILFASRELRWPVFLFISSNFYRRDSNKIWLKELKEIYHLSGAVVVSYSSLSTVLKALESRRGIVFSASESSLKAHWNSHDLFRVLPANFLKVTLQHGFECPGFLNSREHDNSYGDNINFSADLLCTWQPVDDLKTLLPENRSKVFQTGPTSLLSKSSIKKSRIKTNRGLICENLHSVRVGSSVNFKENFPCFFKELHQKLTKLNKPLALRPHPAGQYSSNHKSLFGENLTLVNQPIYKINLTDFSYGISSPSSIIIDMLFAKIPVAVLCDAEGDIDVSNYQGLTKVKTVNEAVEFILEAERNPKRYIDQQEMFLKQSNLIFTHEKVRQNYLSVFKSVDHQAVLFNQKNKKENIIFIANSYLQTLSIHCIKPISYDSMKEKYNYHIFYDSDFEKCRTPRGIIEQLERCSPSIIVFCRYTGKHAELLCSWAKFMGVSLIYFIDDDLLNVPYELGKKKYIVHNDPSRIKALRYLLNAVNVTHCSTKALEKLLPGKSRKVVGQIPCAIELVKAPQEREHLTIGYMGFNHSYDLRMILPEITKLLRNFSNVTLELFGRFDNFIELEEFPGQVSYLEPILDYDEFQEFFSKLNWDIGLCPLANLAFNQCKTPIKWMDYTSIGASVVASKNTVYDECGAEGRAMLVGEGDSWYQALEELLLNPEQRLNQVKKAQAYLEKKYTLKKLSQQLECVFELSKNNKDLVNQ